MKKNFTLILTLLLSFYYTQGEAQTQFWSDDFDAGPTSGTRTPEGTGGTGTPATSYFKLTDGSTVSQEVAFTGKQGTNYWAGEDHNALGTGLPSAGGGTDDINDELTITWTGINITGKTGLNFKGLFAANSTNQPWDTKINCASTGTTTNTDYIIIQYQINGGVWTDLIRFFVKNLAAGNRVLTEDTDGDSCGDGTSITNVFGEFTKNITGTGTTLNLRINVYSEGDREEWGIDNFRLFGADACVTPTAYTVTGGGAYCSGGTGSAVGLSNSDTGVTYQLKNGATDVGSPVSGTGTAISFGNQTAAATYTVLATRTAGS
ncbi:hypothetical protein, partial [Flavobacterium taihuense]